MKLIGPDISSKLGVFVRNLWMENFWWFGAIQFNDPLRIRRYSIRHWWSSWKRYSIGKLTQVERNVPPIVLFETLQVLRQKQTEIQSSWHWYQKLFLKVFLCSSRTSSGAEQPGVGTTRSGCQLDSKARWENLTGESYRSCKSIYEQNSYWSYLPEWVWKSKHLTAKREGSGFLPLWNHQLRAWV